MSLPAVVLATATAVVVAVSSAAALLDPRWAYGDSAADLVDRATAQDVVGLVVVGPLVAALTWSARHHGTVAADLWRGALVLVAYNAAIHAFAVDFGPLFPAWVAALGLAVHAVLLGPGRPAAPASVPASVPASAPASVPASVPASAPAWAAVLVVAIGGIFAAVWLGQVGADLVRGGASESAAALGLPTNPVHVLDLALVVPGALTIGIRSLRGIAGRWELPSTLLVLLLLCLPILLTPAVQAVDDHPVHADVLVPFGVLALALAAALLDTVRRAVRR
jgi:hypothetical protein